MFLWTLEIHNLEAFFNACCWTFWSLLKLFEIPLLASRAACLFFLPSSWAFLAYSWTTLEWGFKKAMNFLFFNGFFFWMWWWITLCWAGFKTFWTESELMILAISAWPKTVLCKWYPLFSDDGFLYDPNTWSKALNADYVQIMNLPKVPPGANILKFNLWTLQTSTPGIFLTACGKLCVLPSYTNRGPFLNLYLWFLTFPIPGLTTLASTTLSISSKAPNLFKKAMISFVF